MCAGHGSQHPTVSPTACWTHPVHVCSSIQSLDPLLQLPGDRLTMLPMPTILSLQQWHAVMHQTTVTQERLALLQTQGSLMADDELRFHLNEVVCQRNKSVNATYPQVAYAIDPLLFTSWIGSGFASGAEWWSSVKPWLPEHFVLVTLARVQQHWIPLQFIFRQTLHVFTWDEPERDHSVLKPVFEKLCSLMGCNHYVVDRTHRLFHCPHHYKTMAMSYLQYVLLRTTVVETQEAVVSYHQDLRKAFELAILKHPTVPKPWIWGDGGEALAARLADVLKEHGVPKDLALSRAHSALKVLGDKEVSTALQHSEKPKAKRVPKHEDAALDPTKLHVLEGTFRCNGQVLPQIGLSQVGPMAAGVILADAKDAAPYLKGSQPVSSEPLALLILGDVPDQMRLPQTSVSVPCSCSINREPVLLDATMVQLGQHHVAKHEAPNAIILDQIDVATIKFTIFRDETEPDWKEIQRSPVRYLVNHFPLLKLCLQEGCQCGAWHNPSKLATHEVIQDVWRRQFLTKTYKPAKAQDAYCYSVCLRVPEEIRLDLLSQSGHAGTYLEPRTHDAKGVDDEFVVVWAPKLSHSELQVMRQTRPAIIGLARVQERKGLRVRADQAQGVHDLVRPGTMYLPPGSKSQWLCGPFPYGCDRVAISKALDQIKWRARPLQPMMHCPGKGTMWLIVSVDAPPASIIQMAHGEIVLSKHKSTTTDAVLTKPAPVATAETLALCEPKASKSMKEPVDLLQVHDPWKMTPPGLPAPAIAPSAQQSLREMEARIESAVMAKINAAPTNMESDDVQDRITQLEQQVGGIMNKQTQLESTVHETAVQHTNQLGSMQQQINQQSTQLHGHLESHKQSMACMFESQMQQIRQLLSKRSREEGHEWQFGPGCLCLGLVLFLIVYWGIHYTFCRPVTHVPLSPFLACVAISVLYLAASCQDSVLLSRSHSIEVARRRRKFDQVPTFFRLVFVLSLCRLGEASNPGPRQVETTFRLGTFNPSGLNGKASVLQHALPPADCWLVSETHLSSRAFHNFKASLRFEKSLYRFCIPGHHAPARAHSHMAGSYKGVALLSKHPSRSIPAGWSVDVQTSSRVLYAASQVHSLWITFGLLYGEPQSPQHPLCREHNDKLLHAVATQVCFKARGPRAVGGDLNVLHDSLPSFNILKEAGFKDIQQLAWERWGLSPRPTSKGCNRLDFLFLSPELQQLLTQVQILDSIWADHSVLLGHFWSPTAQVPATVWCPPTEFPWPQTFSFVPKTPDQDLGVSQKFATLWEQLESQAASQSAQPVPKTAFGRAKLDCAARRVPKAYSPLTCRGN